MHDDVRAQAQRLLQRRGGERVVDHDEGAGIPSELRQAGDVGDAQQRVARGLDPQDARRLLFEGGRDRIQVAHVDDAQADAPGPEDARDQPVRAAVHVVAEQDFVTRLQHGAQQRVFGGEAGRERQAVRAALERGDLRLERGARGVAAAAVLVALAEAADAVLRVRRREVHRRDDRARGRVERLTGVHGEAVESAGGGRIGHALLLEPLACVSEPGVGAEPEVRSGSRTDAAAGASTSNPRACIHSSLKILLT